VEFQRGRQGYDTNYSPWIKKQRSEAARVVRGQALPLRRSRRMGARNPALAGFQ